MIKIRFLTASFMTVALACQAIADDTPIRIGATMSETGAYATQGRAASNGYRLCEQHLNDAGGLLGRPVEFIILDDQSDSDTAAALYEQLITDSQVDAIMGPYGSTLTEAVAPVTERHQMVHVTPLAATSSIWEQGREYLFMVLPPAELFLAGLIDIADGKGLQRAAILQEDSLFPRAAGNGAAQMVQQRGMQLVFHESYRSGQEDFSELIQALKQGEVEVLAMAASNLDDFIRVRQQMADAGLELMFGTSGAVDEFAQALGEKANGSFGLSAWEPSLPNPGIEHFVEAYQHRFHRAPSFHAAGAYGACQLFAQAIRETASLDQDALRTAMLNLETTTVFGPYAVDERGYQTANQGVFIQWQEGEKVVVWPDDLASGAIKARR